KRKGDPALNLIYLAHSVKTISGIPYTTSNTCAALAAPVAAIAAVISWRGVSPPSEVSPRLVVCRFGGGAVLQRSRGNTVRPAPPRWGDSPRRASHSAGRGTIPYRQWPFWASGQRSEEHTSALQSLTNLVCRLLLEK